MEEIKIGEFLRLDGGKIVRYGDKQDIRVENNRYIDYSGEYEWETRIVKHSSNIIDLIEVGDYVNGYKVYDISTEYLVDINKDGKILHIEKEGFINATITEGEDDIKSICTKEQFENAEYRLED